MNEDTTNKDNMTKKSEEATKMPSKRLFSREEIEGITKEFIRAYIRGQINVNVIVLPENYKKLTERQTGMRVDEAQAQEGAINLSMTIPNVMLICIGIKEASDLEYCNAINLLFGYIVSGRASKSIEGEFLTTDIDRKLADVENEIRQMKEKTDSTDTMIKTILDYCERLDPAGVKK